MPLCLSFGCHLGSFSFLYLFNVRLKTRKGLMSELPMQLRSPYKYYAEQIGTIQSLGTCELSITIKSRIAIWIHHDLSQKYQEQAQTENNSWQFWTLMLLVSQDPSLGCCPLGEEQWLQWVQGQIDAGRQWLPWPPGHLPLNAIQSVLHHCLLATACQNCWPSEWHLRDVQEMIRKNGRDKSAKAMSGGPCPTVPPSHVV